jgi:TonB family protein
MTTLSFLHAAFFASVLVLSTPGTSQQAPEREILDSVVTGRKALTLAAFESALAERGSKAGVPPSLQDRIREGLRSRFAHRIVPLREWRNAVLILCYQHNLPFPVAEKYISLLCELDPSTVDTGFLELVRVVDLAGETSYELGRMGPGSPKVSPPVLLQQPLPPFTDAAREDRIEGMVLLQADVLTDGSVANIRVTRPLGYGLDESAVLTVQEKWKFRPAQRNGQPVNVRANIEVSFRLY